MIPFTLTRTRAGAAPEALRTWGYRPTAGHIRDAGVPEDVVRHLATHTRYSDGDVAYELALASPAGAAS